MGEIVYTLCALTSIFVSVLLVRSYARQRTALLLWSAVCFLGLAVSNILMFVDLVLVETDLSGVRAPIGAAAMLALVLGLATSTEKSS